jgi:hypothetical protein
MHPKTAQKTISPWKSGVGIISTRALVPTVPVSKPHHRHIATPFRAGIDDQIAGKRVGRPCDRCKPACAG